MWVACGSTSRAARTAAASTTSPTSGFNGAERRAHGRPAPGYQLLLGGHVGKTEIEFGQRAMRLPAKACAEATVRIVGRFAEERRSAKTSPVG